MTIHSITESHIIRKQAEAIQAAVKACEIKSATDDSRCYSDALVHYAKCLCDQADELESK